LLRCRKLYGSTEIQHRNSNDQLLATLMDRSAQKYYIIYKFLSLKFQTNPNTQPKLPCLACLRTWQG